MKHIGLLLLGMLFFSFSKSQQVEGAFLGKHEGINHLILLKNGYCSYTQYKEDAFICTFGGPYTLKDGVLTIDLEYDTEDASKVGTKRSLKANLSSDKSQIQGDGISWNREKTKLQDLDGLWRITGRKVDDQVNEIPWGDRKTIKLLVDGYFQWMAINPKEKGFFGSGGGRYTFSNKKYTENILFFSRDDSRVGAELPFEGELVDGKWHHGGLSSTGDPIFEVWSKDNGSN